MIYILKTGVNTCSINDRNGLPSLRQEAVMTDCTKTADLRTITENFVFVTEISGTIGPLIMLIRYMMIT